MILTLKDLLYIGAYVVSIITLFAALRNDLKNNSMAIDHIRDIIFGDRGTLNLIDRRTCQANLDEVFAKIRQSENEKSIMLKEIKELNKNVLTIMITLKIHPEKMLDIDVISKN